MKQAEIDAIFERLQKGETVEVPFHTTLYPETQPSKSTLQKVEGGFLLTTKFHEFAAGHGWSLEQTQTETTSEDEIRQRLSFY